LTALTGNIVYSHCPQFQIILDWPKEIGYFLGGRLTDLMLCPAEAVEDGLMSGRRATESGFLLVRATLTEGMRALRICRALYLFCLMASLRLQFIMKAVVIAKSSSSVHQCGEYSISDGDEN
jgi:hypothetical protein